MNKFEFFITLGMILIAIIVGFAIGESRNSCDNPNPIVPDRDVNVEKIDMAYDIDTNQTYWKYPNETLWRVLE